MRVLFVCHGNVGRSQVGQVYFDKLSAHEAESAGIGVDEITAKRNLPSAKLKHVRSQRSVGYIKEEFGVDIGERERRQLTPQMVDEADLVIVIAAKSLWPDYLKEGGKVVFWDIPDAYGRDEDFAHDVYRQVQRRVEQLVEETG